MRYAYIKLLFTIVTPLLFFGCANQTFTVKPDLVDSFEALDTPTDSETHVYVIRGSQYQGGGRKVLIGVNDVIHGALGNKTHSFLKLESGVNTISLIQSNSVFSSIPLDNRPKETVFIYLDYEVGSLTEARPQLGKTMVQETNFIAPYDEVKENASLNDIIFNPGWLDLNYMKMGTVLVSGDDEYGVITIARPGVKFKQALFDIWSENTGLIGSLSGESFIQVRVPVGKNKIFTFLGELSAVEIDVSANNNYYVEARFVSGLLGTKLELIQVSEEVAGHSSNAWTTSLDYKALDLEKANLPNVKERIEMGMAKYNEIINNE